MSKSQDWIIQKILDFMTVLYQCYMGTTYAADRSIYAKDIAMAMGWLVELRSSHDVADTVKTILSPETDKFFSDYWRQGEWGQREVDALKKLQDELKGH